MSDERTKAADLFKSIAEVFDEIPTSTAEIRDLVEELRERALAVERKLADERLEMERIRSELLRALDVVNQKQETAGEDVRAEARRISGELSDLEQQVSSALRKSEETSSELVRRVSEAEQLAQQTRSQAVTEATQAMRDELQRISDDVVRNLKGLDSRFSDIDGRIKTVDGRISKVFVSPPPSSIQVKSEGAKVGERRAINFIQGSNVTLTVEDNRDGVDVTISASGGGGGEGGTVDVVSNVAADRILGRITSGSGNSEELTAAQVRTLLNVEDGATADQTAAEILTAVKTVDGSGSGLDADTVDGSEASALLARANHTGTQAIATVADLQTTLDAKQPLDSDLTAIAAANNGAVLAATTASFTTADETKLDGIEAGADVTDAANVAAAGAVMDTGDETIAGVKTFSSDPIIPNEAYHATNWNGSLEPPTKDAVRDVIEGLSATYAALANGRHMLTLGIDGGGSAPSTGVKTMTAVRVPWACTVVAWHLYADVSGSIVLDVLKDTHANFPPTDADRIAGTDKPTLSSAQKATSTALTGWTTALAEDDIVVIEVESVATVTHAKLVLEVTVP